MGAKMGEVPQGTAEPCGARKPAEGSPQGTRGGAWQWSFRPGRDFVFHGPRFPALKRWAIFNAPLLPQAKRRAILNAPLLPQAKRWAILNAPLPPQAKRWAISNAPLLPQAWCQATG